MRAFLYPVVVVVVMVACSKKESAMAETEDADGDRRHHYSPDGGEECQPCDPQACPTPTNCLAGMVKDHCGCCFVCGQAEGERCDHPKLTKGMPSYIKRNGYCGENLECKIRTDLLPSDPLEALCVCTKTEVLCGSDGKTYENECQLTAARYHRRDGSPVAVSRGPCISAPKIVAAPQNVANRTGSYVAMSCEVTGWPIPTIEWKVDRGDGNAVPLPSDDSHIAVQTRGGPSQYEVTSWLQIIKIVPSDQATYLCVAQNSEGEVQAAATLTISDAPRHRAREEYDSENDL